MKIRQTIAASAIAFAAFGISAANAIPVSFDFSIGADVGHGTVDATSLGGGAYVANSGTVDVTASSNGGGAVGIWTLYPGGPSVLTSPSGAFTYDNTITPANDPTLDLNGLLFTQGADELNIYGNSPDNYGFYTYQNSGYAIQDASVPGSSFTITSVPEPVTLSLFGAGLAGAAALRRRKKKIG